MGRPVPPNEVDTEIRLLSAQGLLASRPAEQLAVLVLLVDDEDRTVSASARATLEAAPRERIEGLLARADAPTDIRAFFAARGIEPAAVADPDEDTPLVDAAPEPPPVVDDTPEAEGANPDEPRPGVIQKIASMSIPQRVSLAMKAGGRNGRFSFAIRTS
jgi:hypothetical protein